MRVWPPLLSLCIAVFGDEFFSEQQRRHDQEVQRQLREDPLNAFLINPFPKPKFGLNLHTNDSLPRDVVVHSYNIQIEPFFGFAGFKYDKALHNTFHGQISIAFSVLGPTSRVELASAVTLSSMALRLGRRPIKIVRNETGSNSHLTIFTAEELKPNEEYTLYFKYSNNISVSWHGAVFYREYLNPENETTSLVSTIFETIHAREAFPCFDDPFFKATFNISLIHPKNAKAYSNEAIAESRYFDEQRVITRFQPTPKMSTYLVAFAIGDFVESEAVSKSGVVNKAITIRNRQPFFNGSAEAGAHCVNAMEALVDIRYPLKKLDHLDSVTLAAGAMENFGLNIYGGYIAVSFSRTLSTQVAQKRIICHETAHQWFGDLVTADRWGWEFLHESFANYFEIHTMAQIEEFKALAEVSKLGALLSAVRNYAQADHAIVDKISHFDHITYGVGGGYLNALRHVLSDRVFYNGLTLYQRENAYNNAGLDTLLQSWVKARGSDTLCGSITFTEYASDHFLRAGVPVVHVDRVGDRYVINQTNEDGLTWNTPIYVLDLTTDKEHVLWLQKDGQICSPDGFKLTSHGEYVFNSEGKGFATFNVSKALMSALARNPKFHKLSPHNFQYNLRALSGKIAKSEFGDLVHERVVKKNGAIDFAEVQYISKDHAMYNETLRIISDNFDFKPTPENRLLGELFLETAIRRNVPSAAKKAIELFEEFKEDCAADKELVECPKIPPEWRRAVYVQGAKTAAGKEFVEQYKKRLLNHPWKEYLFHEYSRTYL